MQAQDWFGTYYKYDFFYYYLCSEKEKKKSHFKHLEVVCSIPSRSLLHPSYYHSFGITENYIVFIEQPFKLDIVKMATAYIRGVNWASCLAYHKEDKVFFLMLRNGVSQASDLFHTVLFFIWFINFSNPSFFFNPWLSCCTFFKKLYFFEYYLPSPEISQINKYLMLTCLRKKIVWHC